MAIVRVQGNARATGSGTTLVVTQASAPTSGNLNVLVFGSYVGDSAQYIYGDVLSVVQTGVTWTLQQYSSQARSTGGYFYTWKTEVWVGVVGAGALGSIVITWNAGGDTTNSATGDVCEYSGLSTSGFLDKTAASSGIVSPTNTGTTATTSQANELWIGAATCNLATHSSPTNGFTLLDGASSGASVAYLEKIVSATGTANSGTTLSINRYWAGCIATLKATVTGATETIIARTFPMQYLATPVTANELKSQVTGATISNVTKDFPKTLIKSGKAQELISKWS